MSLSLRSIVFGWPCMDAVAAIIFLINSFQVCALFEDTILLRGPKDITQEKLGLVTWETSSYINKQLIILLNNAVFTFNCAHNS